MPRPPLPRRTSAGLPARHALLGGVLLAAGLLTAPACTGKGDDTGAATDSGQPAAEPGPLVAGVARARIPAPVGIGTAGYGPFGAPDSPTPFSELYPGTTRLHGHPELKVVALSRGDGFEVIFVRVDAVGFFQQLRRAVVLELQERTGRDLDDALVFGATHTHSGPARIVDGGGLFDIIADVFFPEFYERFIDTMADTIEAALADQRPARLATVMTTCEDAHQDRRCDDGLDYTNGALPLVAVERDGVVDALVMAYAIHGTVLGIDDLTLSQDVSGAIEQAVEDGFDHPVEVMMLNAWAADMSPGSPEVPSQTGLADRPGGYDRMEQIGSSMAASVHEALGSLTWVDEPDIGARVFRYPIDRDSIGYAEGEFPYDYGGVYCEGGEEDCDPNTTIDDLDQSCLPFNETYPAPNQTVMSAGVVGDFTLVTFPGEPGTLLAEQIMGEAQSAWPDRVGEVLFVGYGQDYLGYAILEEDWWQGGYEASGALWGPRQGEYLAGRAVEAIGAWLGEVDATDQVAPITPFDDPVYTPYVAEEAIDGGVIGTEPAESLGPQDEIVVTVIGGDPWLGPPTLHVETTAGEPVLRPNGLPVSVDDYEVHVDLVTDPSYAERPEHGARSFQWTYHLPVQRQTVGWFAFSPGEYQLRFEIPLSEQEVVEATTRPFTVTAE